MCKTMGLIVFAHTHIILFSTFTSLSLCPLPWPVISFLPLKVLLCFAFETYLYVYMYEYVLKSGLCMWDWMPCLPHISTLQPPLIYLPPIVPPLTNCPLIKTGFWIFFWVWLINFFYIFFVCVYICHSANMEVGGKLLGVSSCSPPCGFWGLTSDHQAWKQVLPPMNSFPVLSLASFPCSPIPSISLKVT